MDRAWLGLGGCGQPPRASETGAHRHQARPPHSGTAVALGDDAFHVEFVRDAVPGALASCVPDDEIEEFVRGGSPGFTVMGTPGVEERALKYRPVADSSTGETLASTSLYKASRPWIKTAAEFDTVIKLISVHGQVFADVVVHFSTDDRKN